MRGFVQSRAPVGLRDPLGSKYSEVWDVQIFHHFRFFGLKIWTFRSTCRFNCSLDHVMRAAFRCIPPVPLGERNGSFLVCAVPSGLCKSELLWSRSRFQEFSLALGLWRETSSCDALIFYLPCWGWMRAELTQLHVSWSQLFPPKHILYPVTHTHRPSPLAWSPAPLGLIVCSFFSCLSRLPWLAELPVAADIQQSVGVCFYHCTSRRTVCWAGFTGSGGCFLRCSEFNLSEEKEEEMHFSSPDSESKALQRKRCAGAGLGWPLHHLRPPLRVTTLIKESLSARIHHCQTPQPVSEYQSAHHGGPPSRTPNAPWLNWWRMTPKREIPMSTFIHPPPASPSTRPDHPRGRRRGVEDRIAHSARSFFFPFPPLREGRGKSVHLKLQHTHIINTHLPTAWEKSPPHRYSFYRVSRNDRLKVVAH